MTDTVRADGAQHRAPTDVPGHPAGDGLVKPDYDDRLANPDLAPLRQQSWSSYNIFAFWTSDVHSLGGYVTAGALCSLGIASWSAAVPGSSPPTPTRSWPPTGRGSSAEDPPALRGSGDGSAAAPATGQVRA